VITAGELLAPRAVPPCLTHGVVCITNRLTSG
jgi:hypothetical protein